MQRHGIGRQLQPPSSGSTPHDRVTSPHFCASRLLALDPPRKTALRYRPVVANRRSTYAVRHRPPLIRPPLHRHTISCDRTSQTGQLACGAKIPIAPAAPPYVPKRGFLPWRLSDAGRLSLPHRRRGRHPKPFTQAEISDGSNERGCQLMRHYSAAAYRLAIEKQP